MITTLALVGCITAVVSAQTRNGRQLYEALQSKYKTDNGTVFAKLTIEGVKGDIVGTSRFVT